MIVENLKNSYYGSDATTNLKAFNGTAGVTAKATAFFLDRSSTDSNNTYDKYVFKPATATGSGDATKSGYYVLVGTDDTAETKQDYKVTESSLTHKFGAIYKVPAKNVALQVESVYENATDNDIVIKEVALMAFVYYNSYNTTTWDNRAYMVARKVLASPLTIHSGEIYKFVYKIDI